MRPRINVELDNPTETYDPGQIVSGRVFIDCEEDDRTNGLEIVILGEAFVQWTGETESRRSDENTKTVLRISSEKYFWSLIFNGNDGTILSKGRTTYPFSVTLPLNIPCSFSGPHGSVKYEVKVHIKRPLFKSDNRFSKEFQVTTMPCDLNILSFAAKPLYSTKDKTVCCFCCKSGPVRLVFELHRMGYVPGEYLAFKTTVRNFSKSQVSGCKLALLQQAINYAEGYSKTSSKEVASVLLKTGLPLLPGTSYVWEEDCLQIPIGPPSKLAGYCKIIDVEYLAMMEVQIRGSRSLRLTSPIVIGTIPLNSLTAPQNDMSPVNDLPAQNLLPM